MSTLNRKALLSRSPVQHPMYNLDWMTNKPQRRRLPTDDELDLKLSGGFDTRRSNLCTVCYVYKTKSGACGCE